MSSFRSHRAPLFISPPRIVFARSGETLYLSLLNAKSSSFSGTHRGRLRFPGTRAETLPRHSPPSLATALSSPLHPPRQPLPPPRPFFAVDVVDAVTTTDILPSPPYLPPSLRGCSVTTSHFRGGHSRYRARLKRV